MLLMSGYGFTYAGSLQVPVCGSSVNILAGSENAFFGNAPRGQETTSSWAPFNTRKKVNKFFVAENEEESDDLTFAKKYAARNNYFSAFYNRLSGYFCTCVKNRLFFCEHFSFLASYRYLLFRVIRI